MPPEVDERGDVIPVARRPDDSPLDDQSPAVARHVLIGVRFERVDYYYVGEQQPALAGIDFVARPGGVTALAGEIGSGKSTILSLVPRIVDPTSGRLLIGDRDARDWSPIELRRQIGYVSQEPLLLSGSVMDNIRFGREWLDQADIDAAIDVAQLRSDLAEWGDGLDTQVGARGTALSGGQKQRVALARALAGRPSILLLDDCTASLDAQTESSLWRQLLVAIPDCTTLVVTHRPATLRRADQIVLLDRGRVSEIGGFAELNRPNTRFHDLYVRWKLWEDVEGA
jgi:ATP-binding cassette subfamily B protein